MYKKVELKNGFVGMERDVAKLWKEKDIIVSVAVPQQIQYTIIGCKK